MIIIMQSQYGPSPFSLAARERIGDFVPNRPNHQKDEAIEEYIEDDNNAAPEETTDINRQDQMGISEKAKRQSSDEGDRARGKKD